MKRKRLLKISAIMEEGLTFSRQSASQPNRRKFCILVLLAALCWSGGSAFAQNSKANTTASQSNSPAKPLTNSHPQLRKSARDQVAAAVAARAKADPQFKAYVDAVNEHKKNVQRFVNAKKGGAQ